MGRRVFVTNIPVRACVDGWVVIPEDTGPEDLNNAIAAALKKSGYQPEQKVSQDDLEVDLPVVDKWEFVVPE